LVVASVDDLATERVGRRLVISMMSTWAEFLDRVAPSGAEAVARDVQRRGCSRDSQCVVEAFLVCSGNCERGGHRVASTATVDNFECWRSHLDDPIGVADDRRTIRARHHHGRGTGAL
jgi:hypothetical protein